MAEPGGNGGVKITGQMLLSALVVLVMLWAGWITNTALAAVKNAETAIRRIDGIVSTLTCSAKEEGPKGNRIQGGNQP